MFYCAGGLGMDKNMEITVLFRVISRIKGGGRSVFCTSLRDNKDYIRALPYSYYGTITGWGVLLK